MILAVGARTNRAGAEQVAAELKRIGVKEIIYMQTPCGQAHIDGVFNIASHDLVYMYPSQVPYSVVDAMKKKGYRILECPDTRECKEGFGVNFVAIRRGKSSCRRATTDLGKFWSAAVSKFMCRI